MAIDTLRGGPFRRALRELKRAQHMTKRQLHAWQSQQLFRLLCHARDTTAYYSDLIPSRFDPMEGRKVLSSLPILSKHQIESRLEDFRSARYTDTQCWMGTTSGTTGLSFGFRMDQRRRLRVLAELTYFGGWAGFTIGTRHVFLRPTFPDPPKHPVRLWTRNQVLVDTTRLDDAQVSRIAHRLDTSGARVLIGYPWVLELLAEHQARCREGNGSPRGRLHSVITVGGPLSAVDRQLLEDAFGCSVFERYSASEMGTIAGECEKHRMHLNVGSLIAELLPYESEASAQRAPRRLVLTDLFNYAMPFLRYDIEDVVAVDSARCSCGRSSPVVRAVYGRTLDQITSPDGRWIDPVSCGNLLRNLPEISHFQVSQTDRDRYVLRVVPSTGFGPDTVDEIATRYRAFLGPAAQIDVRPVDDIPPLPSGKRPQVLNRVRRDAASVDR